MRFASLLVLAALASASACSRPVLYYPTPRRAPTRPPAAQPAAVTVVNTPVPSTPAPNGISAAEYLTYRHLLVPVAGADMSRVYDSFDDGRDGGRTHHAIDILAPRDTPVLSADDGKILRMSSNRLGGITMYTIDPERRLVYYYAHMDHYNDAMSPGKAIAKGDTLGFVGTTGNAPKDTPHLHFQVMAWPADGKYWNGEPIDPFHALGGLTRAERAERAERARSDPVPGHPDE